MEPVIEIEELTKVYSSAFGGSRLRALNKLTLVVEKGELFGFLGPNGSGKTTTVKLLLGLIFPTSGKMRILGRSVYNRGVKRQIGYLPEGPYWPEFLNGAEVLRFYGQLYGMRGKELERRMDETLSLVGLSDARNILVKFYSKGMRQRIGLGQALLSDPDVLLLDEPTTGLDPIARREIRDVLISLRDEGKTLFVCSHELLEVELMCDRVGIIHRGDLVECGRVEDLIWSDKDVEITVSNASESLKEGMASEGMEFADAGRDSVRLSVSRDNDIFKVLDKISDDGATLISMTPRKESLEDIFVRSVRDGGAAATSRQEEPEASE
jgi:ABC-2 type transport system ATP-binding protein